MLWNKTLQVHDAEFISTQALAAYDKDSDSFVFKSVRVQLTED